MSSNDIYDLLKSFTPISEKLTEYKSPNQFIDDWRRVFGCNDANKDNNVVYIWKTEDDIPRLRGKSNIIYIGKTSSTISGRHCGYAKIEAEGERNKPRYKHILEKYGHISIYLTHFSTVGEDLKSAEQRLLASYFSHHLEYPPLNRMGS